MAGKKVVDELIENINKGMEEVYKFDNWQNHLDTMSKFHKYSSNNLMLIEQQNPNASLVASFNQWKKLDRYVKKGEKALKVLYPMKFSVEEKNDKGEIEKVDKITFRYGNVFDISQTDGKELDLFKVEDLKADVKFYSNIMSVFDDIAKEIGYDIQLRELEPDLKGSCNYFMKVIKVNSNLSELHQVKTIIHELAHALVHDPLRDKDLNPVKVDQNFATSKKEVQAESIAYIVSKTLGLDTSDYSFKYIAFWGKNKTIGEINKTLSEIRGISLGLTDKIQKELSPNKEKKVEIEKKSLKEILEDINKGREINKDKNKSKNKEIENER